MQQVSELTLPPKKNWNVGMERTPWALEVCGFALTSTLAKTALPLYSFARALKAGAIILHGPQLSEKKSTMRVVGWWGGGVVGWWGSYVGVLLVWLVGVLVCWWPGLGGGAVAGRWQSW